MQNDTKEKFIINANFDAINSIKNATKNTPVIIDFNQTLFLRNSTTEYLDSLQPRILGLVILKFLNLIQPWAFQKQSWKRQVTRQWFLIFVPTILMPWTLFVWRRKAQDMAENYGNSELIGAINSNPDVRTIVASRGFNFIIRPILKHLPLRTDVVLGCRFYQGAKDRNQDKLTMIQKVLSPKEIADAIFVTDCESDQTLLAAVEKPFLVNWSLAKFNLPLADVYLPFYYLEKVKRTKENYTLRVIAWDDFPILLLAFSWQANNSLLHGMSMMLLLVSFWCVYELGYYENDHVAEKYEEKPKLSHTFHQYKQMMKTGYPWFWSLVFGFLGVALLEKAEGISLLFYPPFMELEAALDSLILPFLYWAIFLGATRLCFWVYNYFNKHTRTWLYIILQSFRYYGFMAITFTNAVGTSILSAHILSRSILYVVYRYSGGNADSWPEEVPVKLLRCLIFIFLLSAIALGAHSLEIWQTWQTWAILFWCFVQGNSQIRTMLAEVKPVFKDGSNEVKTVAE